jgi:molybdenum cofactor guanylyltransferase
VSRERRRRPFLPRDSVREFHGTSCRTGATRRSHIGGQPHPVIGLWRVDLRRALLIEQIRAVDRWTARCRVVCVAWPDESVNPFFNPNAVEDLEEAEGLAKLAED